MNAKGVPEEVVEASGEAVLENAKDEKVGID